MMNNEDEGYDAVTDTRVATLALDLNTKAAADPSIIPDKPTDLHIWVYSGDVSGSTLVHYENYGDLNWVKVDNQSGIAPGEREYYIAIKPIKLTTLSEDSETMRVYALVNSKTVDWQYADFSSLSEKQLKTQTFTGLATDADDNSVPMYGFKELALIGGQDYYHTSIDAERCVAKMELYFTRSNNQMKLSVQTVNLTAIPDKGYLVKPENLGSIESTITSQQNVFTGVADIDAILARNVVQGDFSQHYTDETFDYVCWSYLLERDGMPWITATGRDDVYDHESVSSEADEDPAYILTLQYTQGTLIKEKALYLSNIERNTRYRIFVRATEDVNVEINSSTVPWIEGEGEHTVDVTPGLPVDGLTPAQ